jgi:60 kDa SS-A/Ro ribonucleoprotein
MTNKNLFKSLTSTLPRATAMNHAGGTAYALPPKHALAQLAATGCFNNTYYAHGDEHLTNLIALAERPAGSFRRRRHELRAAARGG